MVPAIKWEHLLSIGLLQLGFEANSNASIATKISRFQSHYGCNPNVLSRLLFDMHMTTIPEAKIDQTTLNINIFLMCLYFLRCYPTEVQLEAKFKLSARTVRKWVWFYLLKIQAMSKQKVCSNHGCKIYFFVDDFVY